MGVYHKMRKLIAVFLLSAFLLSIVGDMAVHQYLVFRSDKVFNHNTKLGLYNINDLTEVKIPVRMPGIADWQSYEKLAGEVRFADVAYNYVAIKMTRTAIYLQCVPNYETTRLLGQNMIYAGNIKGFPVSPKQHIPLSKLSWLSHFNLVFTSNEIPVHFKYILSGIKQPTDRPTSCYLDIPEQPPKPAC